MKDTVVIKGSKSGIILVLSPDADYQELKKDIASKFKASAVFLGESAKAIAFKGRKLTDEQKMEIIDIIHQNCSLSIVCILEDDPAIDAAFRQSIENRTLQQEVATGQFYKGNLRSGQVIDMDTSVIIIGDVKPGAKVISKGNVIILGSLKGNVYAGSAGNKNAFVVALDMHPVQIRIADTIARAPDVPEKNPTHETKIAFLDNGNIYIEPFDKDVMPDIHI